MLDDTRNEFLEITRRMIAEESIEGLILGCTEIPLLLNKSNEEEFGIPFFDTSRIHVQSAFRYCLS
jgi:aspartate racemase